MDCLKSAEYIMDSSLPISIFRRDPQPPYPLHSHEFSELVIVYGGSGIHFDEREETRIEAGEVFIVHGKMKHGYRDLKHLQLVNLIFDLDYISTPLTELKQYPSFQSLFSAEHSGKNVFKLDPVSLDEAMRLTGLMEAEIREKRGGYRLMIMALFMQLTAFIARCYEKTEPQRDASATRLGKVLRFMEKNYQRPIIMPELMKIAGMSQSSLNRAFLKFTGKTPIDYLISMRVQRACTLLVKFPEKSVGEIASETGFSDSNYFSRQFKKVSGKSPVSFRKNR